MVAGRFSRTAARQPEYSAISALQYSHFMHMDRYFTVWTVRYSHNINRKIMQFVRQGGSARQLKSICVHLHPMVYLLTTVCVIIACVIEHVVSCGKTPQSESACSKPCLHRLCSKH